MDYCAGGCRFEPRPDQNTHGLKITEEIVQLLYTKPKAVSQPLTLLTGDAKEPTQCLQSVGG